VKSKKREKEKKVLERKERGIFSQFRRGLRREACLICKQEREDVNNKFSPILLVPTKEKDKGFKNVLGWEKNRPNR